MLKSTSVRSASPSGPDRCWRSALTDPDPHGAEGMPRPWDLGQEAAVGRAALKAAARCEHQDAQMRWASQRVCRSAAPVQSDAPEFGPFRSAVLCAQIFHSFQFYDQTLPILRSKFTGLTPASNRKNRRFRPFEHQHGPRVREPQAAAWEHMASSTVSSGLIVSWAARGERNVWTSRRPDAWTFEAPLPASGRIGLPHWPRSPPMCPRPRLGPHPGTRCADPPRKSRT